jgi:spore germination cell wall hydrolase CwlJ-like protein
MRIKKCIAITLAVAILLCAGYVAMISDTSAEQSATLTEEPTPEQKNVSEDDPVPPRKWTYDDVDVISRMVWGEARGVSRDEQKLVVWTVINRIENGRYGTSLIGIVTAPSQFHGYSPKFPVAEEIKEMVIEVLEAWDRGEQALIYPPFATTPDYLYFNARRYNGRNHNFFRERWR